MKNKGKKISKASKAIINQKPMTYVTARHPKTASNLSKPIEQSKKITQDLKIVQEQDICDTESVTTQHPKTATELKRL